MSLCLEYNAERRFQGPEHQAGSPNHEQQSEPTIIPTAEGNRVNLPEDRAAIIGQGFLNKQGEVRTYGFRGGHDVTDEEKD